MRRFKRHSMRGRSRRKTHWEAARGWRSDPTSPMITNKVDTSWARWPSGTVDDSFSVVDFEYIVPEDVTLVSTQFGGYVYVPGPSLDTVQVAFGVGLIAWDSTFPSDFDRVTNNSGLVPGPLQTPTLDWVHRWTVFGTAIGGVGFSIDLTHHTGWAPDSAVRSKAQRKLPAGTGLLACTELVVTDVDLTFELGLAYEWEYRMIFKDP